MKRILEYAVALVFILIITSFSGLTAYAGTAKPIEDNAVLFSSGDSTMIEAAIAKASGKGTEVYVATTAGRYIGEDFCRDYGYTENDDLILIVITDGYDGYHYDVYTYGKTAKSITDKEINRALDNKTVFNGIKGGDFGTGVSELVGLMASADSGRLGPNMVVVIAVSLLIAAVIAFTVCAIIYAMYKRKSRSEKYPLDKYAKLGLHVSRDMFAGCFVTRRHIERSNGSRGGGGGSRSGGGSGHRGGR